MTALDAYGARAQEYADVLGSLEAMAPPDRRCIEAWASGVDGPILDAGCGPGHWTAHLASLGHEVQGMDPVPEFVEIARRAHPGIAYSVGSFADLHGRTDSWGGILAWYSLIHLPPEEVPDVLTTLHRVLRPTGQLLLGFFDGSRQEGFDHAVAPAQSWPVERMDALLQEAGFTVLDLERRRQRGSRPHAAIAAARS